ncbi:MAG: signal peptidase II [Eubacterium sp.]|nr:signal peptidase II [Eubacterium sp.]
MAFITAFIMTFFDQLTKNLAVLYLKDSDPYVIIDNVFELYYLENHGAAFSILQGKQTFFTVITVIFLIVCALVYIKIAAAKTTHSFAALQVVILMLFCGATGNFIDRITNGYVVDFFYFKLINFPVFNVADIYITVAAVLLCILILFVYKDEDLKEVFGKKNE